MPEWKWIDNHYRVTTDPDGQPVLYCRRCGLRVTYLTKHAAIRHGDPITIEPVINDDITTELYW